MRTVLLVDDDDFIREHLARALAISQVKVITAANGSAAIKLYGEHKPDCVFLDIKLPDFDGIEVFKRLQGLDSKVRAYFLSGSMDTMSDSQAKKIGALGFLAKPVDIFQLQKIIACL